MLPKIKIFLCVLSAVGLLAMPVNAQSASISQLQEMATQGDINAQISLARTYDAGIDVPQNFALARSYFQAAALQGDATAQNRLGQLLRSGLGGDIDAEQAVIWLTRAADQGNPAHIFNLAEMYENGTGTAQDYGQAAVLYARAANAGHTQAQVSLGVLYQNGSGVEKDPVKARELFQTPAAEGNAKAQNNLGLLYVRGNGVDQDYDIAFSWFEKAANAGLKTAMTNLGVMYKNGFGVAFSDAEAAKWYRLGGDGDTTGEETPYRFLTDARIVLGTLNASAMAAEQAKAQAGDPVSMYILAAVSIMGPDPIYDPETGAFWLSAAAERGLSSAQANLGLLYQHGIGVPQDFMLAYMWMTVAAAGDSSRYGDLKDKVLPKMTQGQVNEAQERANRYGKPD